jgi:predicted alpha-1,2-mannosidase
MIKEGAYKRASLICLAAMLFSGITTQGQPKKNLLPYVNPFIGTYGHAHTFPGACFPFGMVQLSPDTRLTGWDGCSGYHFSDNLIYGFSHTHLSGTGCSDYGDILLMPTPAPTYKSTKDKKVYIESFSSTFSHQNEKASPGYYSVLLDNGIKADLTVSERAGMHRYIFPKEDSNTVVLDLKHRGDVISSELHVVSDTEINGYRRTTSWAKDRWVYFDIRFSKPIELTLLFDNQESIPYKKDLSSKDIKAVFRFKHSDTLLIKVGISAVSEANAAANLSHDIPGWNFEGTLKTTQAVWNQYLNRIEVSSPNDSLLTTFYSALYHTAIHPSLFTDINGEYRGHDDKTHVVKDFSMYTVFSIWDTYRSVHPLYTLIAPSMDKQFIQTFLKIYEQTGTLPIWELWANETNCMIGYHTASIISDAFQKKIWGYDIGEAQRALLHSATQSTNGLNAMSTYGYIPSDKDGESVSKTLEYSYDDWCIAMMAKAIGNTADYMHYMTLAQAYKNVYDPETGFMRARINGGWYTPFDPREVNYNYTEANAWQYSFYVPQDISGLIRLHGGKEKLGRQLDSLFKISSQTTGRVQDDITGMIGQYAQGNEPSHYIAYLFDYLGMPWKTADYIKKIEKLYTPGTDGLCGNEDCGQMSAWYVLSAMGMYQECPGDGQFELTTPLFDTVKIHLENGNTFSIVSHKDFPQAKYIYTAALNQKDYEKSFILYDSIIKGGTLKYELSSTIPSIWGVGKNNIPVDSIESRLEIIPQPYVETSENTFKDSVEVNIKAYLPTDKIYYTVNDSTPNMSSTLFTHPFYIHKSATIKAVACRGNACGMVNTTSYVKVPKGISIKVSSTPSSQYTAGGPEALIDYQHGSTDFRLGKWQGYQGQNFEAVVDLGKVEEIKKVGAEFLQDVRSWIFMPQYVDFSVSVDGRNFTQVGHVATTVPDTDYTCRIEVIKKDFPPRKVRYIKVFAKNYGKLPPWHPGAGDDAYIFIDEIMER